MAALQHRVTLVALNGREKEVQMRISPEGVQLLSANDGKVSAGLVTGPPGAPKIVFLHPASL